MIHLATVFSGIGAVEHALTRLGIEKDIVFACDNGERKLKTKHRFFDGCDNSKYSSVCDAFDEIGMGIFGSNFKGNFYDKQKDEA